MIAAKAGYKPEGAIWLQHKFMQIQGEKAGEKSFLSRSVDLFSTHPPSLERLGANRVTVAHINNVVS